MYLLSVHKFFVASVFAAALSLSYHDAPIFAQDGDNIEGAIWQFEMTKKGSTPSTVNGQFRVSDHVIYQKEKRDSPDFAKKVGTNKPNGELASSKFDGLRVFGVDRTPSLMNGVARLQMGVPGEWSGTFTDSDGANWEMKLSRVKE